MLNKLSILVLINLLILTGKVFADPSKDFVNCSDYNNFVFRDSISLENVWGFGTYGEGMGKSGIIAEDIDNDGIIEIVCGGSSSTFKLNKFWYILEYSNVLQEYLMHWFKNYYPDSICSIAAFDIDNDGVFNIYVGLGNGNVYVYDGSTLEEIDSIHSPANQINRFILADIDNDLTSEISFCDTDSIFVYNAVTLSLEWQIPYGAKDFEVGDVDYDPRNEIILANGLVLEFDGASIDVEWNYSGGDFGDIVELSDIDFDGMEEIVAASEWFYITAFDADIQSFKWQIQTQCNIDALLLTDIDDDHREDVLYGDGQWGSIHCYDAISLNEKWSIPNPESGVTNIAVFDTDKDNELEVIWGSGHSSTGLDYLYIYGVSTLLQEWKSVNIHGPFYAIDVGDIDSDGMQEIVVISRKSEGIKDGIVYIFDAVTHHLEWQSGENVFGAVTPTGIHDLAIGDVDDDGDKEIVVAMDSIYYGAIYIINGISHEIENAYIYDEGATFYSVLLADVDNDSETEIITGSGEDVHRAPGAYVYIIDGSTGLVEWQSNNLGSHWSEIYALGVGDIDNDSVPEIVAINDSIFAFDGISHEQWKSSEGGYMGMDLYDIDDDLIQEIVVGTNNGDILAIDGQSYQIEFNFNVSTSSITALRCCDIDKNGNDEILFVSDRKLNVFSLRDSIILWQSASLGGSAGGFNSLVVRDFDSDEHMEAIIGTWCSVFEFEEPGITFVEESQQITYPPSFSAYPNPSFGEVTINLHSSLKRKIEVDVYDVSGRLVYHNGPVQWSEGSHLLQLKNLQNGIYFLKVELNGVSIGEEKLIILR